MGGHSRGTIKKRKRKYAKMKRLNEEVLRQLLLMNFDGSKTLLEQGQPKLGDNGGFNPIKFQIDNPDTRFQRDFQKGDISQWLNSTGGFKSSTSEEEQRKEILREDKRVADLSFKDIAYEIDGGWAPWKWGTDEDGMTDAILRIKNNRQYSLLRKHLKDKYKSKFRGDSILGFIQEQEFSLAVDPKTNDNLRKITTTGIGGYGVQLFPGQEYQYRTNDKYLRSMVTHLQKFNPLESMSISETTSLITAIFPPAASAAIHTILPVLTIVLSAFPPAAMAAELADAGLYYAEGDPYSAGLGLCFALIPAGQFFIMSKRFTIAEKQTLMGKMQLKAEGKVVEYTPKESKLLLSLGEEGVEKMIKKEIGKRAVKKLWWDNKISVSQLYRVVWWLVKNKYLPVRFLTTMGLTIGGGFMTWDAIAAVLGVCNTMDLKGLTKAEEGYLKAIGGVASFLQQFSTPCERSRAILYAHTEFENRSKGTKVIVLRRLEYLIKNNLVYTSDFKSIMSLEVWGAQLALRNLGYTKYTEIGDLKIPLPVPAKTPTNVLPLPPQQTYDPTGGIGASRKVSGLPATGNPKLDSELTLKSSPIPEKKVVDVVFKWGFYDYNTKMVIKAFQKNNNLKDDGELGPITAKKLIEKITPLSSLNDYGNKITAVSPEETKLINAELVKKFNKDRESKATKADLDKPIDENQKIQFTNNWNKTATDATKEIDPTLVDPDLIDDECKSDPSCKGN